MRRGGGGTPTCAPDEDRAPLASMPDPEGDDEVCSICIDPLHGGTDATDGRDVTRLGCDHRFHTVCIATWERKLRSQCRPSKCPMCQNVYVPPEPDDAAVSISVGPPAAADPPLPPRGIETNELLSVGLAAVSATMLIGLALATAIWVTRP
eukprot:jgi/Tetstr1/453931/TSEL_040850.t1